MARNLIDIDTEINTTMAGSLSLRIQTCQESLVCDFSLLPGKPTPQAKRQGLTAAAHKKHTAVSPPAAHAREKDRREGEEGKRGRPLLFNKGGPRLVFRNCAS